MAQQSQFHSLNKKILYSISVKLIDESFNADSPYVDFDGDYNNLVSISNYFSITAVQEDVEFFAKFIEINDELLSKIMNGDKSLINGLEIPVAKSYRLNYHVWGSCTYTEYKYYDFDSYDKDWVKDSAQQQIDDGDWSTWDGQDRGETDYDNFDDTESAWEDVEELDGQKLKTESLLSKLVVENTSEVVSSLDRQTLLKLKSIIDSRLKSL